MIRTTEYIDNWLENLSEKLDNIGEDIKDNTLKYNLYNLERQNYSLDRFFSENKDILDIAHQQMIDHLHQRIDSQKLVAQTVSKDCDRTIVELKPMNKKITDKLLDDIYYLTKDCKAICKTKDDVARQEMAYSWINDLNDVKRRCIEAMVLIDVKEELDGYNRDLRDAYEDIMTDLSKCFAKGNKYISKALNLDRNSIINPYVLQQDMLEQIISDKSRFPDPQHLNINYYTYKQVDAREVNGDVEFGYEK